MNANIFPFGMPDRVRRSAVGFDDSLSFLAKLLSEPGFGGNYPPYDLVRLSPSPDGRPSFRIDLAVAGFAPSDLDVRVEGRVLSVEGRSPASEAGDPAAATSVHRGIARRAFARKFVMDDHVRVTGAVLANGLLSVSLERVLPDSAQPRRIPISLGEPIGPRDSEASSSSA